MKPSRLRTLLLGLLAGVAYAFLTLLIVRGADKDVSVSYIFALPLIMGAIPVLFSTREQLQSYVAFLVWPIAIVLTFFYLALLGHLEGFICLIIIIGPFLVLGSLGAFIFRLIKLKSGHEKTPLYSSLLLPFLVLAIESNFPATDHFYTVRTHLDIKANSSTIWQNIKNIRHIKPTEIKPHFIHLIGIPKPLDGALNRTGIGGVRSIVWERGIRFRETITSWQEGRGFAYNIEVDPQSIPPSTLDDHVMVGGKYFDVIDGSYRIDSTGLCTNRVTLTCRYRVTTNLTTYSKWWSDFVLNDFNETILEVIKQRCEAPAPH